MSWLEEELDPSLDENAKLFKSFHLMKNYLHLPKENFLFLEPNDDIAGIRCACFVHWLIENVDWNDVNIFIWATRDMSYTTESGPWTRTIYQDNEGKTLTAVRNLVQHLKIPTENVLFLVPGDEFVKEKCADFVSNIPYKYKWSNPTIVAWLKCQDKQQPRTLKRMLM